MRKLRRHLFSNEAMLFAAGLPKMVLASIKDGPQQYRRGVASRKDQSTNSLRYFYSPPLSSRVLVPPQAHSTAILPFYKN